MTKVKNWIKSTLPPSPIYLKPFLGSTVEIIFSQNLKWKKADQTRVSLKAKNLFKMLQFGVVR